jgi:hypothetical protein
MSGGGVSLNSVSKASTEVTLSYTIERGAGAARGVRALTSSHRFGTSSAAFTVGDPTPSIASISPSAWSGAGVNFTITGTGFGARPGLALSSPDVTSLSSPVASDNGKVATIQAAASREVIFRYMSEACRVLAPGGVFWFQANGQPGAVEAPDTWGGARVSDREVATFAREAGVLLMAVEAPGTQYMAVTIQKPVHTAPVPAGPARIRSVTDAYSSVPAIPARGRWAFASIWVEGLPADSDLNSLEVTAGHAPARPIYLGLSSGRQDRAASSSSTFNSRRESSQGSSRSSCSIGESRSHRLPTCV